MAQTIKHKRSSTASAVPAPGDLVAGEIAINTADEKLYIKNSSDAVVEVGGGGGGGATGGKMSATLSSNQSIPTGSSRVVEFDNVEFDTLSELDVTTNVGRYTPTVAGYYNVFASAQFDGSANTGNFIRLRLFKNAAENARATHEFPVSGTYTQSVQVNKLLYCNGTTDFITVQFLHTTGGSKNLSSGIDTHISIHYQP